ncbi:MAG: hypothetical protein KDC83_14715 [Flavobacteriales bacterium]|nr:hypothetical protein [Flavobacteriales bacterium]
MNPLQIQIDIESEEIQTRQGKKGDYHIQTAYIHTFGRDGQPERYPREFNLFPDRDNQGRPIPYKKGSYTLHPKSYRINNGFLELAFPSLIPVKP